SVTLIKTIVIFDTLEQELAIPVPKIERESVINLFKAFKEADSILLNNYPKIDRMFIVIPFSAGLYVSFCGYFVNEQQSRLHRGGKVATLVQFEAKSATECLVLTSVIRRFKIQAVNFIATADQSDKSTTASSSSIHSTERDVAIDRPVKTSTPSSSS
ncbi:unnamed protein product, partial [Allacma fusca]